MGIVNQEIYNQAKESNFECLCGYTGKLSDVTHYDNIGMHKDQQRLYIKCPQCQAEETSLVDDNQCRAWQREQKELQIKFDKLNQKRLARTKKLKTNYLNNKYYNE